MIGNESQSQNQLQPPPPARLAARPDAEVQRKRMLIALGILLVALGAVIVRDWDFWFPSRNETPEARARHARAVASQPPVPAAAADKEHKPSKPVEAPPVAPTPVTATAERAVLPPLQVEVVAGNRRTSVAAKSNAIHLDVGSGQARAAGAATVAVTDRVQLSPQTQQNVSVSVPPDYPLLARQMKVQGAVSLQALIARDGTIQELQIVSGPEILAAAAREAVKQWHFKPYLQNGQPVETQAKITVNFTISTN